MKFKQEPKKLPTVLDVDLFHWKKIHWLR